MVDGQGSGTRARCKQILLGERRASPSPSQAAAAEAAATAAATLHLSLARATLGAEPQPKSFTVTEGAGEPIAASLADYRLQSQVLRLGLG